MGVNKFLKLSRSIYDPAHLMYKYYESTNFKAGKGFFSSIVEKKSEKLHQGVFFCPLKRCHF